MSLSMSTFTKSGPNGISADGLPLTSCLTGDLVRPSHGSLMISELELGKSLAYTLLDPYQLSHRLVKL